MKTLSTEQQSELRELLENVQGQSAHQQDIINYWILELKPKRVRRNLKEELTQ